MKKVLRKLFIPCMVFGCLWSEVTLYIIFRQSLSPLPSFLLTLLALTPFIFYGIARISKAGKLRRVCNLIGAALLSADCYFMIITAFCGLLFLLGLPLAYATTVLVLDLILCTAAVLAGMLYARRVRVTSYTLRIKDAPNCKIVFFSDLHLGDFCTTVHLKGIVKKIQKLQPDLVLYGGDLVDMDLPGEKKLHSYARILSEIAPILGCEGNHDLNDKKNPRLKPFLEKAGIRLLYDENTVDAKTGIPVIGRKSIKTKRQSAKALCPDHFHILLDHDPKGAAEAMANGCPLVLCGHTHKGQTFPGNIIRALITPYFYGKYEENGRFVITTSGCGATGLPLRLFVTSEIVAISIISD